MAKCLRYHTRADCESVYVLAYIFLLFDPLPGKIRVTCWFLAVSMLVKDMLRALLWTSPILSYLATKTQRNFIKTKLYVVVLHSFLICQVYYGYSTQRSRKPIIKTHCFFFFGKTLGGRILFKIWDSLFYELVVVSLERNFLPFLMFGWLIISAVAMSVFSALNCLTLKWNFGVYYWSTTIKIICPQKNVVLF